MCAQRTQEKEVLVPPATRSSRPDFSPRQTSGGRLPWIERGDIDGFFGLFIDNLLQLMLISVLCGTVCGFPAEMVARLVLPGAAVSVLAGNLFYAWQARQLMRRTGRRDVTALPYGINTPTVFAYIFLIMGPVYQQTGDARMAWQAGLAACALSAVIEIGGAFVGDWLRRHTPRAALLSALAGVALTFISMGFVFQMFASPAIALLPMLMIMTAYASGSKPPLGLPAGFAAVLVGTGLAWILRLAGLPSFEPSPAKLALGFYPPVPVLQDLWAVATSSAGWTYLSVILPMGLFNVIGSLQNLESAEAAGDRYETRSSLLVNGLGSMAAAGFGSPFPTTIYIGHPGWKTMGARAGYSVLNGLVVTILCFVGAVPLLLKVVPLEAVLGILLWIGVMITAQAFQAVPASHAPAVALGLVPCLAAWALQLVDMSLRKAGSSLHQAADAFGGELSVHGLIALNQGFLLTSIILTAVLVFAIEHRFLAAAAWTAAAALLSGLGVIHAYELGPAGVLNKFGLGAAPAFFWAYALAAAFFVAWHFARKRR
jgi:adenine/guanine/hypoxanthine permease